MKLPASSLLFLFLTGTVFAQSAAQSKIDQVQQAPFKSEQSEVERAKPASFPAQITNIVVIVQENRSPDNLFQALTPLCTIPSGASGYAACTPSPVTSSCYDVSPCGLDNESGSVQPFTLVPVPMSGSADPNHQHSSFEQQCDPNPKNGYICRNDGAWHNLHATAPNISYSYVDDIPVTNYNGSSGHLLDPYVTFAQTYGWANFMYQTNQGPSYPAHQFLFSGTSARTLAEDGASTFISENFAPSSSPAGCLATAKATNKLLSPLLPGGSACTGASLWDGKSVEECTVTNSALIYPTQPVGSFCFYKDTMATWLDMQNVSWKYYAPSAGKIWTAPDSIQSICDPQFESGSDTLYCAGSEWASNVDLKLLGADVLNDIDNCKLAQVSWVIPNGSWSDHAGATGNYGPSWVAAIINAIGGLGNTCGYWNNTAVVVTWDDWGGWSDNQIPPYLSTLPCTTSNCQGDYQYGFRVPLIVVSAYTPQMIDSTNNYDFGSILRTIEGVNGIQEGILGVADARSANDLSAFFQGSFRSYTQVPALEPASYFLGQKVQASKPVPPDDDGDDD